MQVAGVPGVGMAAAEADGKKGALIRPLLCAAPLKRIVRSAPTTYLRSAPVGYSADCLRNTHRRPVCVAARRRLIRDSTSLSFLPSAPMGYDADRFRAAPHRPACASEDRSKMTADNPPEDTPPKAPASFWEKILAILRGDIFKLVLLAVSVFFGCAATKENKIAGYVVDACDKTHKVYNITSKALPVILAFFKG